MAGLKIAPKLKFNEIAVSLYSKAGASNSWIDTDITASVPTNAKFCEVQCINQAGAALPVGVREPGSTLDRKINSAVFACHTFMARCINGHIEMFEHNNASGTIYAITGYYL